MSKEEMISLGDKPAAEYGVVYSSFISKSFLHSPINLIHLAKDYKMPMDMI